MFSPFPNAHSSLAALSPTSSQSLQVPLRPPAPNRWPSAIIPCPRGSSGPPTPPWHWPGSAAASVPRLPPPHPPRAPDPCPLPIHTHTHTHRVVHNTRSHPPANEIFLKSQLCHYPALKHFLIILKTTPKSPGLCEAHQDLPCPPVRARRP